MNRLYMLIYLKVNNIKRKYCALNGAINSIISIVLIFDCDYFFFVICTLV